MTGIVLAGGRSSRMGTDKADLPWKGGTLLTAAIDKLLPLCREIIVVGPYKQIQRNVIWTKDYYVGKGPLAGLHAGLEAASFDGALILPCDMPLLPQSVLEKLVLSSKGFDVVLPVHTEGYEPLCAWYRKSVCLPVITDLLQNGYTSPLDILPRIRVCELEVGKVFPRASAERQFMNLNYPKDYEAVSKRPFQS